ncbi:PAS domain S-box protein [Streptomyces smyrnaeus]|uniref:PAS domain S-box protein n=1 Tax=Streptomyces smyrnaeus TaxID=1387713 RepID=A0ABS3Y779_9ACTN|nr:PAS domain S-box protein [Streptomyces smyrnaeus]
MNNGRILPVSEQSSALFIGVDSFTSLENLPAVRQNLSTLGSLFSNEVWNLGPTRCEELLNPSSMRVVDEAIFRHARAASDTLLLYYAGHGVLDLQGRLHLAMPDSDPQAVHSTAFPYDWMRMGLAASSARRCIVVLDCCFSARAMGLQSAGASMAHLAEVDGTYVLAAAAENAFALAPPGEAYTAFTGALVSVLSNGIAAAPELLDLDTVFRGVQSSLRRQGHPEPQCLSRNHVGGMAFARNAAYAAGEEEYSIQEAIEEVHRGRSLSETIQVVADQAVRGLGYQVAAVNLVMADGDLTVAAISGSKAAEKTVAGRVGPREAWERILATGSAWGNLVFVSHSDEQLLNSVPQWYSAESGISFEKGVWHPMDRLFAPLYASDDQLQGVLSVDRPRNGRRPGAWGCEALQMYASQAAIAISNARLRSNMQRAMVRLEREQQTLRNNEESFRQAFEYAPSGMAVAEMGGNHHGRLLRINDALCRLLGRPAAAMRRYSLADLVHPDDFGTLLRTSAEGGRAKLRLARRDGSYVWVSLRNSVVADTTDGPRYLLTHVDELYS